MHGILTERQLNADGLRHVACSQSKGGLPLVFCLGKPAAVYLWTMIASDARLHCTNLHGKAVPSYIFLDSINYSLSIQTTYTVREPSNSAEPPPRALEKPSLKLRRR